MNYQEKVEKAFKNYENYLTKNVKKKRLVEIVIYLYKRYNPGVVIEAHLTER